MRDRGSEGLPYKFKFAAEAEFRCLEPHGKDHLTKFNDMYLRGIGAQDEYAALLFKSTEGA